MSCNCNAPISTASVALPGMPSASSGISAPPTELLFAASDAATPSTAPEPKDSGSLLDRCARL